MGDLASKQAKVDVVSNEYRLYPGTGSQKGRVGRRGVTPSKEGGGALSG